MAKRKDAKNDNNLSSSSSSSGSAKTISGPKKLSLRFNGCIHEDHKEPVYALSFYDRLPLQSNVSEDNSSQYFASVGSNRATIYTIEDDGALNAVQAYVDEDIEEIYYTSCWSVSTSNTPLLLIGGLRGFIKVISCTFGEIETTLIGHGNAINEIKTHPVSPALILSASRDESVRLWNVYTSCCIAIFAGDQGHRDQVISIDFHILGHCFASSGMDNTIKIWSLEDASGSNSASSSTHGKVMMNIEKSYHFHSGRVDSSRGSGGGSGSVTPSFRTVHEQFPLFSTNQVHSDYVDCVRWMGNILLSKSTDNKVVMWKPDVFALHGHSGVESLNKVHIDKDWRAKVAASLGDYDKETQREAEGGAVGKGLMKRHVSDEDDSSVHMVEPSGICLEAKPGAVVILREFKFRDAEIWFVRFSLDPQCQLLSVGNKFGKVWVWNVDSNPNSVLVKNHGHLKCNSAIRQTAFSPDGKYLLCCCEDGSIWKWAVDT